MRAGVAIVLPVHDAADFVGRAVAQLQAQSHEDFDCVVVDDGSQDGTVERFTDELAGDVRFTVVALPENRGVAAARNAAVARVDREWVWFVDVDDEIAPDAVETLLAATGADVDLVLCSAVEVHEGRERVVPGPSVGVLPGRDLVRAFLAGDLPGYLWNKMFRRSVLGDAPFPSLSSKSDVTAMVSLLDRVRAARVIEPVLYRYVRREGSITGSKVNRAVNALAPARAMRDQDWEHRYPDLQPELAMYRMRSALAYIHDAHRFGYQPRWREEIDQLPGWRSWRGAAHSWRDGRRRVALKGAAMCLAPEVWARVVARWGTTR